MMSFPPCPRCKNPMGRIGVDPWFCLVCPEEPSDITSPVVPADFVQDGECAETPVSEELEHQRHLDTRVDENTRAKLVTQLLRQVADRVEAKGDIRITPTEGGSLLGVVVAMMQASGWRKNAGEMAFSSVWGNSEDDDGQQQKN